MEFILVEFFEIFKNEDIGFEILKQISVLASTKRLQIEGEGLGGGPLSGLKRVNLTSDGMFFTLISDGGGG